MGRCPYHPKMMLKVIVYAYMNNIYSCRKIEKLLSRDIHFIWLAGYEKPDFITINRFRNRVKDEINKIFTQLVLILAESKRVRDAAFFLIIMLVTFAATLLKPQKYVSSRTIQKCVEHVSTST